MEFAEDPDDPGLSVSAEEEDLAAPIDKQAGADKPSRATGVRHSSDVFIAEGVYTDCDNILKKFLSLKTSTFEDFGELWRERKFSLIYAGRDSHAEVLEFTEESLAIAKSFILPPNSKVKRIGALYLMYGLYSQQPKLGAVKFRVTPQEWSVILKFIEDLKAHGFLDANYIFHKMCIDGAFLTVAHSRQYGLERNYRKYLMPWPARDQELNPSSTFSLETLMGRVYRGSLKAAADKCLSKYNSIKQILGARADSKFQGVAGTEVELESAIQANIDDVIDPADFLGDTRKFSNIGVGRKFLKEKAFLHKSLQKGAHSSLLQDEPGTSEPSTSQINTQISSELESSNEDESSLCSSDSEDSEFKFMVKPPSRRNSRRLKSLKREKMKKLQEGAQEAVMHSHKTKRQMKRCTKTSKVEEIPSLKLKARKSKNPLKVKGKGLKTPSPQTEEVMDTNALSLESFPLELDDDEHDTQGKRIHTVSVDKTPDLCDALSTGSRPGLRETRRSTMKNKKTAAEDETSPGPSVDCKPMSRKSSHGRKKNTSSRSKNSKCNSRKK